MYSTRARAAVAAALISVTPALAPPARAQQHEGHTPGPVQHPGHDMFMRELGGGWHFMGMAQIVPLVTRGFGSGASDAVTVTDARVTQPAIMFNVESPGSRIVLRTTLNFEGITMEDGELTLGGWGEGFIDRRHPHTLLHEAMLSVNFWNVAGGALSLSAGKGFAPFGTDDPMSRPVVKYPTNHHLSQILERAVVSAVYRRSGWSIEAGVFGGTEPTGPYDFSNFESFADSWSARVIRRFGGTGPNAPWEVSASYGYVVEEHDTEERSDRLLNAYVRHDRGHAAGHLYALLEASLREPTNGDEEGYFSVLGEAHFARGRHQPYLRVELATRPEYERQGAPGSDGFYRYDHDDHPVGATRWFIASVGYGYEATRLPVSARPFVELQFHNPTTWRGDIAARELLGSTRIWAATAGVRLFLGGGPMRMGAYGVLDPMTSMMREGVVTAPAVTPHRH